MSTTGVCLDCGDARALKSRHCGLFGCVNGVDAAEYRRELEKEIVRLRALRDGLDEVLIEHRKTDGTCLGCGCERMDDWQEEGVYPETCGTAECIYDMDHEFEPDEDGICELGAVCGHNWYRFKG
jgi:hypothetical protein